MKSVKRFISIERKKELLKAMFESKTCRIVLDTNVIISGLLWTGSSNKILKLAEKRLIKIYASPEMTFEFSDVIKRVKFAKRIHELKTSVTELTVCLLRLIEIIKVKKVKLKLDEKPVDTDDEMFIFCSLSAL